MNREEAVKFNEELKAFMEKQAAELGLDKGSGDVCSSDLVWLISI